MLAAASSASRVDGAGRFEESKATKAELTAIIEEAPEGGYWAVCAEVPGANGQGETIEEAKLSLRDAIRMIFEDRLADMKRGLPEKRNRTSPDKSR